MSTYPLSTSKHHPNSPPSARWLAKLGAGAFLFFALKGAAWLVIPAIMLANFD